MAVYLEHPWPHVVSRNFIQIFDSVFIWLAGHPTFTFWTQEGLPETVNLIFSLLPTTLLNLVQFLLLYQVKAMQLCVCWHNVWHPIAVSVLGTLFSYPRQRLATRRSPSKKGAGETVDER